MRQLTTPRAMHEIFISICEKGMHEEESSLQFVSSLKILGNYGTSNDVVD